MPDNGSRKLTKTGNGLTDWFDDQLEDLKSGFDELGGGSERFSRPEEGSPGAEAQPTGIPITAPETPPTARTRAPETPAPQPIPASPPTPVAREQDRAPVEARITRLYTRAAIGPPGAGIVKSITEVTSSYGP